MVHFRRLDVTTAAAAVVVVVIGGAEPSISFCTLPLLRTKPPLMGLAPIIDNGRDDRSCGFIPNFYLFTVNSITPYLLSFFFLFSF